jgi:diadenosine tetraphosphatase ApaH/serine/threonine PP2A family protein phosphatase
MLDTSKREVTFRRTPYDIDAAAGAIRASGLPEWLAERLFRGT